MRRSPRIFVYLLRELVGPTLLGLSVYGFILLMNAFLLVAKVALSKDLGWETILRLFLYEIPTLLVLAIPMATILGVLIAFGRLSADHEATAIQAAGLGPASLLGPVVVHGTVLALVSFGTYALVVPETAYASRALNAQVLLAGGMGTNLTPRVFYSDIPGYVLFASEIRPGTQGKLEGLFVHQEQGEGGRTFSFLARNGDLYRPPGDNQRLIADLRDGVCHVYRTDRPESYRFFEFERYQVPIEPPAYFKALSEPPQRAPQNRSFGALFEDLGAIRASRDDPRIRGIRARGVEIEIQQRMALPAACLLFAILGVPLGLTRARSGRGAGFALSIAVTLVYWILFTSLRDQASQGRIPPFLGVWAANLAVGAWAAWAFWRLRPGAGEEGALSRLAARLRGTATRVLGRLPGAARSLPLSPADDTVSGPALSGEAPSWACDDKASRRWLGLVDRHIGAHFLRVFAYSLLSAYAIFVVVELRQLLDGLIRFRRPPGLLIEYFKYFAPGKLGLILPVSCLVAAVVAFTILGRSGELTALKASGTSMRRATLPVLALTLALCGVSFVIEDQLAPVTNQKALAVRDRIQGKPPRTYGMPAGGRWTFGSANRLYHYRLYDPNRQMFQGLSVLTIDRETPSILEHRFATLARWNGRAWVLEKGWRRTFPARGSVGEFETYDEGEVCALDPPETFGRREAVLNIGANLPDQMSVAEIREQVRSLRDSGYDTTRLEVAFHSRIAQPLTPFVMVLLGLPFAFQVGRRGSLYGIGIALLLVIVYWATFAVFNALGFETVLPPVLASWAPNVLYGLLGSYLLLYVRT